MAFFKQAKKLFGNNIDPACEYCEHGCLTRDQTMILCNKKGIVSPFYSCNKFAYLPTKRIPRRRPKLPEYSKEDFSLDV